MNGIKLCKSDEIVKHPDGEIDEIVLESLLNEAKEERIAKNKSIIITIEKRVNSDFRNPQYEKKSLSLKLSTLYSWYKMSTGNSFRPKTEEEKIREEDDYKRRVQGAAFLGSLQYR
jgi:hypothetical protein